MDDAQVASFYRRYGPVIYRHCRRMVDSAAAEDLTQEAFVRLWRHRDRVRTEDDGGWPLAWVHRVATNVCLNYLRDNRRSTSFDGADREPHRATGPESRTLAKAEVKALLGGFDKRTQSVVMLVLGAGFTQDEAASSLNLSRRTVGKKLRGFLAKVRPGTESEDDDGIAPNRGIGLQRSA